MSRVVVINADLSGPARSDSDLWHAVCSGDEFAFRDLFLRYSDRVRLVDHLGSASIDAVDNTEAWVESESTMQAIRQALAVLPRHQRDVVELVAWSGLSMAEAAATLKISVGTAKSRLSRARSHLANTEIATLLGESR
jgi:RNA polymerase sigma factor (sigma-70 family)